jgi:23S rRNA (uracil1939-C5)-methyltransferase
MKKRVIYNVEVEAVAAEGKCVAHANDKVLFLEGVAPGDVIDIRITRKKKNFLEGTPIHFHEYSTKRVTPFCQHFELCGGCKWQHLDYQHQVEAKRQQIIDNFERIGKLRFPEVNALIAASETKYYRNKLEYTFSNKRWLDKAEIQSNAELDRDGVGFHLPRHFDKIVDIEKCYLQREPTNAIRNELRSFAKKNSLSFFDIAENRGLLRNLIVRTATTDQVMVIVQFGAEDEESINQVMEHLKNKFPEITSLYFVINLKRNETFLDLETHLFSGEPYIEETIGNLTFKLGPKSFFQTNTRQTQKLYEKVLEMAALSGVETVYDLYCGTGTIANFIAHRARKVVGIENVSAAVEDAQENAKANNIENTSFVLGDVKDLLDEDFILKYGNPDVVITDPPRAGMHKDVVEVIQKIKPGKLIYVSCNPATQARDLAELDACYEILEIQPFDMFPHTHHLENIVAMKLRS